MNKNEVRGVRCRPRGTSGGEGEGAETRARPSVIGTGNALLSHVDSTRRAN